MMAEAETKYKMDQNQEELWKRYREGNRAAYEQLVESYLPIVKVTVGRMAMTVPSYVSREELYSAGCVGLVSAIERYDPDREAKFTTYAITRIRGAILDELRHHDVLGRVTRERVTRIQRAEAELHQRGEELYDEAVAREAGLSMDEYYDAERGLMTARQVSLSEVMDDGEHTLADLLSSQQERHPGHEIEMEEIVDVVYDMLTEKEQLMVVLYYREELTLKEIGEIMQVSESRVCQIHSEMVSRVRKKLKKIGVLL